MIFEQYNYFWLDLLHYIINLILSIYVYDGLNRHIFISSRFIYNSIKYQSVHSSKSDLHLLAIHDTEVFITLCACPIESYIIPSIDTFLAVFL